MPGVWEIPVRLAGISHPAASGRLQILQPTPSARIAAVRSKPLRADSGHRGPCRESCCIEAPPDRLARRMQHTHIEAARRGVGVGFEGNAFAPGAGRRG